MTMKRSFSTTGMIALVLTLGTYGSASAETVAEILKKVDANLNLVTDQTYEASIKVFKNDVETKSFEFEVKMKGTVMKFVRFTRGDSKGTAILTDSEGRMYVYMPSYQRVRRVASHVRNQGFMGTDLSADDMSAASLSVGWDAKLTAEDDTTWTLDMTPQKGNETSYARMKVTVLKKYGGVSKIEYYSEKGRHLKTQTRSEWKKFGPITVPTLFVVTDHTSDSKTEMRFSNCTVNTGIPDSAFTKRAIQRAD